MKILITGGSGFIGTNLMEFYLKKGIDVLNIDIRPPRNTAHAEHWQKGDIKNFPEINSLIRNFQPDYIIHMAAETGLKGTSLSDYSANINGVENILMTCNDLKSLKKIVFASTMLVCKAGYQPTGDEDFCPTTLYGESKVLGEKMVRSKNPSFNWVIIRPTSIWGPWFGRTYRDFFEMIIKKRYFNFSGKMCTKTYGFIDNVVYQTDLILFSEDSNGKTLYVGDYEPIKINEWAKEIGSEVGVKVYTVPRFLIRFSAWFGDLLKLFGLRFPMNSFRFSNMTTDNILDLSETQKIAPQTPVSRKEANRITIEWMRKHYKPE